MEWFIKCNYFHITATRLVAIMLAVLQAIPLGAGQGRRAVLGLV